MLKMRSKLLVALSVAAIGATSAQATPAFARQMNQDCMACHAQQLPMLNSYGRAFKLSSFSIEADQEPIPEMSLARALNAGVGFKSSLTSTRTENVSETQENISIPSGLALLLGGRIGEGKGVNILFSHGGAVHLQASFSQDALDGRMGIVGFGTSGHGMFIGTEAYNTGLHKELGMFANAGFTNAAQATGVGGGPATGLNAYYGGHGVTASVGYWTLGYNSVFGGNTAPSAEGGLNVSYRLTYDLPTVAGFDIMVGTYGSNGTTLTSSAQIGDITTQGTLVGGNLVPSYLMGIAANSNVKLETSGFDFQVMGDIAKDLNLMVLGQYVSGFKVDVTPAAGGASTIKRNASAYSIEAQVMMKNKVGVRAAYLDYDDKAGTADVSALTFGVQYNAASNVNFAIEHSSITNETAANQQQINISSIIVF